MLHLRNVLFLSAAVFIGAALLAGCAAQNESQPAAEAPAEDDWRQGLEEGVVASLSELSEADRQAALAQSICPVTGEPLGSMGKPPKVAVEGQDVFLCCAGCEEEIQANPEEYLAKLKKEPAQ